MIPGLLLGLLLIVLHPETSPHTLSSLFHLRSSLEKAKQEDAPWWLSPVAPNELLRLLEVKIRI